jgi:hypothetical protein
MKKFIISIVLTVLIICFVAMKEVVAETATMFGMAVSIATQPIDFDPSELVSVAVWSHLNTGTEIVPGRYFFENKAYPAYA